MWSPTVKLKVKVGEYCPEDRRLRATKPLTWSRPRWQKTGGRGNLQPMNDWDDYRDSWPWALLFLTVLVGWYVLAWLGWVPPIPSTELPWSVP